ncbi:FAD-binding oxidoreductase [Sphingobium sp.]|uniref:NAD(P)/FAD-dependent oxidoreductase n=1 Tax=Sphingobium sp. TaxID=1912891 RepID=UPI0028BF2691|nr:FAD-binding oxidoreductase [Sphingobium sp.]
MSDKDFDILVIGGGIAGTALAAQVAGCKRVAVLEMEAQPGYHSTGRSAALFAETYGNPIIRSLTRASRDFFFSPPPEFTQDRLVAPRRVMIFGCEEKREAFETYIAAELPGSNLDLIDAAAALALCPVLKPEGLLGAVVDSASADIEVHTLHQAYVGQLKRNGGLLVLSARVEAISYDWGTRRWSVQTSAGCYRASILANAAGAWADHIASLAGIRPVGLEPRRRTAALVDVPEGLDAHDWPMILDAEESFYMKPDAGLMLISPADETLSEPEDAQPEELDIAIAVDRVETYTTIEVRRIKSKWAGLRTFVKDRSPVVGFDPSQHSFFWMAALGGYGIQTAPALSSLAAKLLLKLSVSADLEAMKIEENDFSPARLFRALAPIGQDRFKQNKITG